MSFEKMKVDELRLVADEFGVDLQNANTKADVVAVLVEEGVTFSDYQRILDMRAAAADEAGPVEEEVTEVGVEEVVVPVVTVEKKKTRTPGEVLVKMTRDNYHYEILGKTFTKEHPFVVMTEEEAQDLFDLVDGFTIAQPREAAEYYS